jgi:dsRNA-specific ribonuclease
MNNIKNKLITKRDIREILVKADDTLFDAKINEVDWYQRAFVHKSYSTKFQETNDTYGAQQLNNVYEDLEGYSESFKMRETLPEFESNERLEFLGDSIVDAIVKEYLYDRFEIQDEGFLTKLKIKLVRSERLSEFANYLDFKEFLLLSNKMENLTNKGVNRGRNSQRFMEDCFEAFVGAIMKDNEESGYYVAKKFMIGLIEKLVDFTDLITTNDNFKDSLLRLFQSRKWGDPKYTELYHEGVQTNRIFTKGVFLERSLVPGDIKRNLEEYKSKNKITNRDGIESLRDMEKSGMVLVSIGKGKSKKEAEQNCGKWALTNLKVSWNY